MVEQLIQTGAMHEQHEERALVLRREERLNALTHAAGFVLSVVAVVVMMRAVSQTGDRLQWMACAIYGGSLIAVYAASALSHVFYEGRLRRAFRMLDQGCIFLLIAGTFTPPAATYLRSGWWWLVPGGMWCVALFGFVSKTVFAHKVDAVTARLHLLMGWAPVLAIKPLMALAPLGLFVWLLAGGICYTVGTLFLNNDHRPYYHAAWHLWVIGGSACHYVAIWLYCMGPLG